MLMPGIVIVKNCKNYFLEPILELRFIHYFVEYSGDVGRWITECSTSHSSKHEGIIIVGKCNAEDSTHLVLRGIHKIRYNQSVRTQFRTIDGGDGYEVKVIRFFKQG